ncbi:NlpC/P60 family protein [Kineococcus indalonis]|uniref:NlpC/P60 family protein n=1 Tax=Kineococcus indalonis TaxID=2696566 RepID=UPI001411E1D8|nr:NlpC/P60 family protein [Kineococcus indalonis]NAZ87855.1 transglycosylase SLT domain-containing protein [Kineococcus indalonis]
MSGVAEVQSRIADIESRIAALSGGYGQSLSQTTGATAATSAAPAASATSGSAFAGVLAGSGGGVARATRSVNAAWTGPAPAPAGASTGEQLLAVAKKYTGVPYKWGGTTPAGFDCSGLIQYSAKQLGVTLPRTAREQAKVGTAVPSLAQAEPGDLVVLENGSHIGIYVGNGQMLHAPKTGDVVKISKVWETPLTIRRLGTTAATTAAAGLATAALLTGAAGTGGTTSTSYVRPASLAATSAKSAPYDAAFSAAEVKHGLPAGLLSAVAKQESGYDPNAKSPAGAIGLMQFMPATAKGVGIDPTDPFQAIDGAGKLLASHLRTFGSVEKALAAYNAGPGNVRKYGGIPPFNETQNYVKKIMATLQSTGSAA